jgi:hypothetical protein
MAKRSDPFGPIKLRPNRLDQAKRGFKSDFSRPSNKLWSSAPSSPISGSPIGSRSVLHKFSDLRTPEGRKRTTSYGVARPNLLPKLPGLSPEECSLDISPQRISLPQPKKLRRRPINLKSTTDPINASITLAPIPHSRPHSILQPPTHALENVVALCAFKTRTGTTR